VTETEAHLALFTHIEGWYNPRRRHSRLKYRLQPRRPATDQKRDGLAFIRQHVPGRQYGSAPRCR
jgi:transposase InsO family protein